VNYSTVHWLCILIIFANIFLNFGNKQIGSSTYIMTMHAAVQHK